jgi:outer membrane protein assembly factor BamD (BamD/ComL family)
MKQISIIAVVAAVCLASFTCAGQAPVFDDTMTAQDYFQRAQDRADAGDYANAIAYYYKFKEKFPDNLEKNTWASYEIAFLHHKMGEDAKALVLLDELLSLYTQDKGQVLPKAPKLLAEEVKEKIINKGKNDYHTASPSPSPAAR